MKTLKLILTILVFSVVAVITGCSDYITSGPEAFTTSENIQNPVAKHNGTVEVYLKLKPKQSHTIYSKQTTLPEFNSFRIESTDTDNNDNVPVCNYLKVNYSDSDQIKSLGCFRSGIRTKEVIILNTSNKLLSLKVTLTSNISVITKEQ